MTSKGKQLPHERRKGESALSAFAEYVEQQQAIRYPSYSTASSTIAGPSTAATSTTCVEDHSELTDILNSLDIADTSPQVRIRDLLLSTDEDELTVLKNVSGDAIGGGAWRDHFLRSDSRTMAISVGMEIMGFDTMGKVVASDVPGRKLSWEEIGKRSAKVISFTDLAGHERYLRTTVFGLLSSSPNYCLLMVAANNGLIVPEQEKFQYSSKIERSVSIRPLNSSVNGFCPIFQVSNVTGESLDLVRAFLNILPHHGHYDADAPFEFHINDTFSVPFVGTVVSGIVKSGVVHAGETVLIGPDSLGQFTTTTIRSIERKRISVPATSAGQSASFALKRVRRKDVRKGMVVLPKSEHNAPKVYREFVAEVLILSHATTIKTKYQAMLHVGPVSQTCAIIDIDRSYIRTGDRATVAFQFVQRPEYLAPGDRLLFREGRTKGLGIVKSVGYDPAKPLGGVKTEGDEAGALQAEAPAETSKAA
ncbi:hypothetical protein DID88_003018 [Monilinia fructigena]|uniref:Translation elongation factor EFTu-like domain-containing protein n=1 Tax=Monilinia fructigena TaxID=38457 RepID=A0A395IFG3_9HELO|nr:hypothetical protein DID88_003018 [Monilinia fructigena]